MSSRHFRELLLAAQDFEMKAAKHTRIKVAAHGLKGRRSTQAQRFLTSGVPVSARPSLSFFRASVANCS
jgi:hypothetical protein